MSSVLSMEPAAARSVAWIVDDSPLELEMARRALATDYDVETFSDGSVALEQLTSRRAPDVIVLDWVMPGVSGIEICQFIRSHADTASLGVLLLTTNQRTEQIVEGLGAGANDYLSKPYAALELRARVDALVRSQAFRRRAEHAETLLRKVLSQLPDALVTFDPNERIVFINAQGARILGLTPAELLGKSMREVLPDLSLKQPGVTIDGRQLSLADVTINGRVFSPRISIPPTDDVGNTTVILRDVTDLRVKEIRQVDFYSMIAHDLRSPLTAVQMRAQMLLQGMRGPLPAPVRQDLEKMDARVRDLVRLVSDFLDIAQMESAQFKIDHGAVDLAKICADAYDEYLPLASARGIELVIDGQGPAAVLGDERRLAQVVGNLVSNALKFTPAGGRVSLGLVPTEKFVEVRVDDTGRGIASDAQAQLFTKYTRIGTSKVEGTGLGLVIVKEIVEAHGGKVGMRSTPGRGSSFWICLPQVPSP